MTASDNLFLDTSPIIYLVENNPAYYSKVSQYLSNSIINEVQISTSVISVAEFGVRPKSLKKLALIDEMSQMLLALQIKVIDINIEIADITSSIRAKYSTIKGFDALQLASALYLNCNLFLTHDKRLKQVSEINVLTMEDL